MTFLEIEKRKDEAIRVAERDYDDALKEAFTGKSHVDICVQIISELVDEDPSIGQVFDCPSTLDHPDYLYGNWTSGEEKLWAIEVDRYNGYFDVIGLERNEYDDIKAKLGRKIKCEW